MRKKKRRRMPRIGWGWAETDASGGHCLTMFDDKFRERNQVTSSRFAIGSAPPPKTSSNAGWFFQIKSRILGGKEMFIRQRICRSVGFSEHPIMVDPCRNSFSKINNSDNHPGNFFLFALWFQHERPVLYIGQTSKYKPERYKR